MPNTEKTKEEIYEKHIGSDMELGYINTPKESVLDAMQEFASQSVNDYKEKQWISVMDELPQPFVNVIVAGGVGIYTGSQWNTITGTPWPGVPIAWQVTHWQPLPSPPKD